MKGRRTNADLPPRQLLCEVGIRFGELGWVRLGEVQRPDLLRLLIAMA